MAFRFVHMADVHLDTPFESRDGRLRLILRDSIRQAFQAGVDLAISKNAHAVLVAGDLFDNDTFSFTTEKFLLNQIQRLKEANIGFFYTPGNHDPYGESYRSSRINWPSNVHIFETESPQLVPVFDSCGERVANIIGAGYEYPKTSSNIAKTFPTAQEDILHIGLLHAVVSGTKGENAHERYAPCTLNDLREKGYDYWALGHVHTRAQLSDEPRILYPGNLVGRNPREDGNRGAYFVEIDYQRRIEYTFHQLAPLYWMTINAGDLSRINGLDALEEHLQNLIIKEIETKEVKVKTLVRVILDGPCPLYRELQNEENITALADELQAALGLVLLELVEGSLTYSISPEKYKNQPHVLSTALEILEQLEKDDELLIQLKPEQLAGCPGKVERGQLLDYLRSLLGRLDYEAVERLVGEKSDEY